MKIGIITDSHWGARNDNAALAHHFSKFYKNTFFPILGEYGVKTILHLGDLMDRRKYVNYVTARNCEENFIKPACENGIDIHILAGNHDTYYKNTNDVNSLRELYSESKYDNLHLYWDKPAEIEFDGCTIMLSPWICADNFDASMKAFRDTKAQILMGHFEISGFEMMKGHLCDHGLDKSVFKKFDGVYSGHFHHPSSHDNITYLGAPYEMNWSDYGGKRGFHIFDTESRVMEFIPNPFSIFHKITYNDTDMTIEDVAQLDISRLTNTFIKVIIKEKNNPYIFDLFLDRLQSSDAADIKVVEDHMNLDVMDDDELLDEAQDTLTILKQYVEGMTLNTDKEKVHACLRELYNEAVNL